MAEKKNDDSTMNLEETRRSNMVPVLFLLLLLAVCAISKCAKLIIGLDIDEQYSVSLAYRITSGDAMIFEMWEPHQTSAIIPALFLKIYMIITGGTDYSVIFLRIVGGLFQGIIGILWFATFRKEFGCRKALVSALLFFSILPKWIQSPEFANQEIWWLTLTLVFAYRGLTGKRSNWLCAGIAMSFCVLSYPSTVIVFGAICLYLLFRKKMKELTAFVSTCVVCGTAAFVGICSQSSFEKVVSSAKNVLTDTSHNESIQDKLIGHLNDGVEILSFLAIYFFLAFLLVFLWSRFGRVKISAWSVGGVMLIISIIDQYRLWTFERYANPHPSVHFAVAFLLFCLLLVKKEEKTDFDWLLLISSLTSFLSVVLISNLDLKASIVHLFPAFVGFILLSPENDKFTSFIRYTWVVGVALSYVILVRFNGGYHKDIFMEKQKALYGPSKGIYCEYMDGYSYNANLELIEANTNPREETFLLGDNDLLYMISEAKICSASIISTPVFDEKYIEYFDTTGRIPSQIIVEKSFLNHKEEDYSIFLEWMKAKYYQVNENEYITIWKHVND